MDRPKCSSETNVSHYRLFCKCENYEAYAIACDMEGMTPIWDKGVFVDLKKSFKSIII